MSTVSAVKVEIVRFVASFYAQHGNVPSVSTILRQFSLNRADFYRLFPSGIAELCSLARVPVPEDRVQAVGEALRSRTALKENEASRQQPSPQCLTLSPEQTRRVYGICHLEGDAEPSLVIDRLLDLDTELRRKHGLSLAKAQMVASFLDSAVARGWKPDLIVEYVTRLWNSMIMNLNETYLANLISLVQGINLNYWGSIENFVGYAVKHSSRIGWFRAYLEGAISLEKLLEAEGL